MNIYLNILDQLFKKIDINKNIMSKVETRRLKCLKASKVLCKKRLVCILYWEQVQITVQQQMLTTTY